MTTNPHALLALIADLYDQLGAATTEAETLREENRRLHASIIDAADDLPPRTDPT